MNVLYVCADRGIPLLGHKGASVHVRSLTAAMQRLGHRVTVVARRTDEGNPPPLVHRIEHLSKEPSEAAGQLEALIAAERPDVVIERYSLQSGAARLATRRHGMELTLEVNAPLVHEAIRYRDLDDPGAEQREHQTFRDADRIHVVSSSLLDYITRVAPAVPVKWIPNGADCAGLRAAAPGRDPELSARRVVGFVGSMKPWHGVLDLIEAFARVRATRPHARLLLVGSGPQDDEVAARIARDDLRRSALWIGRVPHADVPALIASFDVAVAPYLADEQFYFNPLKVIEYLAAGKPVVYSDQGDLPALVGEAGLRYPAGAIDQLADRLARLLDDDDLRARMARAAHARGGDLDWSVVARRVLGFAAGPDAGMNATVAA